MERRNAEQSNGAFSTFLRALKIGRRGRRWADGPGQAASHHPHGPARYDLSGFQGLMWEEDSTRIRSPRLLRALSTVDMTSRYPHTWVRWALTSHFANEDALKSNTPQVGFWAQTWLPASTFLHEILLPWAQCTNTSFYYVHVKKEISSTGSEYLLQINIQLWE